jgi:putative transposase
VYLKEVDSLALSNAQLNVKNAFKNFHQNPSSGFPKFKSKHRDKRRYTTNNQGGTIRLIDDNRIRLPKLKDMKIKLHRPFPDNGILKSATISQTPKGDYYISILFEYESDIQTVIPSPDKVIGLDYSSRSLYIDSEGNNPDYPRLYRKAQQKLAREQKKLSRRMKGGSNRNKQRIKVAKLHEKTANQRKDFLHKASRQITNVYDAVVIEDLNMRSLAQCLHLGKSTLDNGYGMLKTFLKYKLEGQGKQLIVVDRFFPSSKLCNSCHYRNRELTLADRIWECPVCGEVLDRDINAAMNLRDEGLRILGIA